MSLSLSSMDEYSANIMTVFRETFKLKVRENEKFAEEVSEKIVDNMVSDLLLEVTCNVYRAYKLDYFDYIFPKKTNNEENKDAFCPENTVGKLDLIYCPRCSNKMHAGRFATHCASKCDTTTTSHDEKIGRSSSRIASQRIANNSKDVVSDDDDEWKSSPQKSKNGKKIEGKKKKESTSKPKASKKTPVQSPKPTPKKKAIKPL